MPGDLTDRETAEITVTDESALVRTRYVSKWWRAIISVVAVAWTCFQVYTGVFGLFPAMIQRSVTLGFGLLLAFLGYGFRKADRRAIRIYDYFLAALAVACVVYLWLNFRVLVHRAGAPQPVDVALGIIVVLLVLESSRRTLGWPLVIVALVFLFYGAFGPIFPGLLGHRGYSVARLASHLYLTLEGVLGIPMSVMTTYVFAFIVFGAFLDSTGGSKAFIDLAYALTGKATGGPAKTAIIGSGLLGTISGSSLANVVGTGTFTIPLMKKVGYKPSFAGGVEAASSSGGQIMPPVMGAAAFIMAEMTGIPYLQICKSAALPAVLYYASIYVMVHLEAKRLGLRPIPPEDLPRLSDALKNSIQLIFPIVTIIGLMVRGYTPLKAALYATAVVLVISCLRKETRLTFRKMVETLEKAALNCIAVTSACAACGIITGVITLTGLGLKLADLLLQASGGNLALTLVLTMVASILLGMGLPTTAKYIVLATIAVPALVTLDVPLIAANMFIFYYGIIAEVTPPVALTSYGAAAIANAPGVETALQGLRLSFAGLLLPFMFVYHPALLMLNVTIADMALAVISSLLGIVGLGVSLGGYWLTDCLFYERVAAFVAALLLISFGIVTDLVGLVLLLLVYLSQKGRVNRHHRAGCGATL
ncbi:MAG: TRAP transporter permease [Firmicutes bacterium]|nr:TRAP transporter permease [Bacillota bacterium]